MIPSLHRAPSPRRATTVETVSQAQARRFLVRRHLLAPPRGLPGDRASVLTVVEALGSLQFDPLEVTGARNHDLVLHARIRGYRRGWCESWLYAPAAERRLFEAYNKSLNILPLAELPYHRAAWDRATVRHAGGILGRRPEVARALLARMAAEGTLSTAAATRDHGASVDWYWAPTAEGRAVLEALFETGRIAIARREGNRRHYALTETVLPAEHLGGRVEPAVSARHRLLSRHRAMGLLGHGGSTELWVGGLGTAAERAEHRAALVDTGALVPVTVEGLRGLRYVLAGEAPMLTSDAPVSDPSVSFLAPLDPLMWDRRLLRDLFGFEYLWEVYTPEARRRWGYYVLPVLYGDRLVGRIEPRMDRAAGVLRVLTLALEPGFDPLESAGFTVAFGEALGAYRDFVGAAGIVLPRGRVTDAIRRALRATGALP